MACTIGSTGAKASGSATCVGVMDGGVGEVTAEIGVLGDCEVDPLSGGVGSGLVVITTLTGRDG